MQSRLKTDIGELWAQVEYGILSKWQFDLRFSKLLELHGFVGTMGKRR